SFREPMQLLYLPEPRRLTATPYFEALADQRVDAYVAASDVDLSSPVDDRPFFFLFARPADLVVHPPGYILSLYRLLAGVVRISAVLVLLPLIVLRRRRLRAPRAGPPELCHDGRAAGPAPGRGSRERRIQPPADRRPTYAPHRNRRAGGNRVRLHSRPADSLRSGRRFPVCDPPGPRPHAARDARHLPRAALPRGGARARRGGLAARAMGDRCQRFRLGRRLDGRGRDRDGRRATGRAAARRRAVPGGRDGDPVRDPTRVSG